MLLLLPILLLIIAAIGIQILGRTKLNLGQTWILAIVTSTIIWILVSILRIIDPPALVINYFDQGALNGVLLSLNFTTETWVFGFLILTMLGAILLADSSRLSGKNNRVAWSGAMIITAAGILACMSGSFVAFILTSTFLDITLLIVGLASNQHSGKLREVVVEFSVRVAGSLILITTLGNSNLDLSISQPEVLSALLPFFIISLILRMGIFRSGDHPSKEQPVRRNLQVLIQMIVPLTMFAFVSRLSIPPLDGIFYKLTILVLFGSVLFKAIRLTSQDIFEHRIWIEILSGLGIGLILLGQSDALLPLGIVMISVGSAISVTETRSKWTTIVLMVLMLGMIGLPFTPSNGLWLKITGTQSRFQGLLYNLSILLVLLGVTNNFLKTMSRSFSNEKWVDVSNSMSPIILMISPWIYLPWNSYLTGALVGVINPGIVVGLTLSRLLFWKWWVRIAHRISNDKDKLITKFQFLAKNTRDFLKLNWLTNAFRLINNLVEWFVTSTIRMLEGEGGLLWALVFLILLTTILVSFRMTS